MYLRLWQENASRMKGEPVVLLNPIDVDDKHTIDLKATYFLDKTDEKGELVKKTFFRIAELADRVFLCEVACFDATHNNGHKGITLKMSERGTVTTFTDSEFMAKQYKFTFEYSVLDLEGVNRLYFSHYDKSIGIMHDIDVTGIYLNWLTKLFSNNFNK